MFDISWTEILVVAAIAIIVVGPKELPGMLRAFGKTFGQVRRTAREFQSTFNDALREAERQASLDDVKKNLDEVRSMDPTKSIKESLGEAKSALSEKVTDKPAGQNGSSSGGVSPKPSASTSSDQAGEAGEEAAAATPHGASNPTLAPAASKATAAETATTPAPAATAPAASTPAPTEAAQTVKNRPDEAGSAPRAAAEAEGR